MRMERLQFYLEPELNEALEKLASTLRVSKAQLIREGVRKIVAEKEPLEDEPLLKLIGLAKNRTGLTDVAERHDYFLYGEGADIDPVEE